MYTSDDLSSRIDMQIKEKKIKKISMLTECGCNRNTLTQMTDKKGLSCFTLARIADYLDCSVDYLLGRTDDPQSHKKGGGITALELEAIAAAQGLNQPDELKEAK